MVMRGVEGIQYNNVTRGVPATRVVLRENRPMQGSVFHKIALLKGLFFQK